MGPFEFDFGTASTEVTLRSPATMATLLQHLAARWPAGKNLWRSLCNHESPRHRYCYISLDHTALAPAAVLSTPLHDGARVCVSMPMAGG